MAIKNNVRNLRSQCQVVVFPWTTDVHPSQDSAGFGLNIGSGLFGGAASSEPSDSELADSSILDISNYIKEVNFEKNLSEPSGNFEIVLPNDRDWKEVIKRGTWLLIYMTQDGDLAIPKKGESPLPVDLGILGSGKGGSISPTDLAPQANKLRCIGYIDRVSVKGSVGSKGEFDANYVVSGRDFGVVYEETQIWHNIVFFERTLLNAAAAQLESSTIKTVDALLDTLHRLLYSPSDFKGLASGNKSLTRTALQWLLPTKMVKSLGVPFLKGAPFYGNLVNVLNFEPTTCSYPVENPLALLNGRAWDRLKQHSIEPFHELFPETSDDGRPQLNFRPIPWRTKQRPIVDKLFKNESKGLLKNVDRVVLENPVDVIDFELGEDNHSRFNLFFTVVDTSLYTSLDTLAGVSDNDPKTGFPRIQQSSVKRHGLRLMYNEVNAFIQLKTEKVDKDALRSYNELMLDYWDKAELYESGTMTIIGNNSVKIGKTLETPIDAPYNHEKIYYIEGYKDSFTVEEKGVGRWTQALNLTRGIEKQDLLDQDFDTRILGYENQGEFTGDNS